MAESLNDSAVINCVIICIPLLAAMHGLSLPEDISLCKTSIITTKGKTRTQAGIIDRMTVQFFTIKQLQ